MNPYSTLGIPHNADLAAIRDAYRSKAKLYRPDVSEHPDAHERFILITQAYDLLCDPVKRARFDQLLKAQQGQASTPRAQHRHEQDLRRSRKQAERRAAAYSQMGYERFDKEFFSETVSYYGPKMLGCLGIFVVGMIVFVLCVVLIIQLELPTVLIAVPLFAFIPTGAWLSTGFDAWHERRRKQKNR
ncbi:MAG: J domain-containing protein [Flavobacteriales bacterium]|nr:J domain-containing protein [Flavobacteriales bacterium]